jgi:predicted nucleotidyltransferase
MKPAGLPLEIEKDLDIAIDYLKSVGCTEIFIFGSVASGEATSDSDLDIAVRGINPAEFFFVYGELLTRLERPADLIDLNIQRKFGQQLLDSESLKRVA